MRAREGFRIIANRGAVCFDTTQYMREINPLYQFSFEQFVELYDTAISHSDRYVILLQMTNILLWMTLLCSKSLNTGTCPCVDSKSYITSHKQQVKGTNYLECLSRKTYNGKLAKTFNC